MPGVLWLLPNSRGEKNDSKANGVQLPSSSLLPTQLFAGDARGPFCGYELDAAGPVRPQGSAGPCSAGGCKAAGRILGRVGWQPWRGCQGHLPKWL